MHVHSMFISESVCLSVCDGDVVLYELVHIYKCAYAYACAYVCLSI